MTPHRSLRLRLWRRAAVWLAFLGPTFYASYGLANWWATTRPSVPSFAFDWERGLPFWPWTIFPYWTINAFYALSLFLAPSRRELDRHAARLLTATAIAVACFLVWPLRFSFGQPEVHGAPALLFDALRAFDQPFNQAPSLHIALAVILWDWYRRRLAGRRWALPIVDIWAFAICASVLTTWQHHFIDVPTGALLGLVCVWLWPLERVVSMPCAWRTARDPQRWKLAGIYLASGVLLGIIAGRIGGWGLGLQWPAVSLALVGLNYAGFGARGFQMDPHGRMRWAARWLWAPYRLGAWLNARWWTRDLAASTEVLPGLRVGRLPTLAEWRSAGRPRIVSLCAELQTPKVPPDAEHGVRCLPMLDLVTPHPVRLRRAVRLIEAMRSTGGEPVWVCCALGFSRSAASAVGWLALHGDGIGTVTAGASVVRQARPQVVLKPPWMSSLEQLRRPGPP